MERYVTKTVRCAVLACATLTAFTVAAKTKVACIGDSITFGYTLPNRTETCYPNQLQKLLDEKYPGEYEVRNFGNSGRGIYLDSMRGREKRGFRYMKEHQAALEWKPDIVICNLGINDNGEYIKEYTGQRKRGQFVKDYLELLGDYQKACQPKFYIWTKLSPLTEGQNFYRSPEPFLMQEDLERVAKKANAVGIDMQEPLREKMDVIFARDKIHPDAEGARIIAETTFKALTEAPNPDPLDKKGLKALLKGKKPNGEFWICAGQSNMQKGWGEFNRPGVERDRVQAEMARLDKVDVYFWDFNTGKWVKLTSKNGTQKSAYGVSFAIRRAEQIKKPVYMLYVASGGAPTESFLSEQTMCKVDSTGKAVYPNLMKIATNRHQIQNNADFPCKWCAREYPRRHGNAHEAHWWPVSLMYDHGIKKIQNSGLPIAGILWYQGESNATTNVAPDTPLADDYVEETLRAIVEELRGKKKIPFVMMGLPKMNRPWEAYRALQKKVCEETGAIFVDSFGAGLGDPRDVHPRDKIPFAELAIETLKKY